MRDEILFLLNATAIAMEKTIDCDGVTMGMMFEQFLPFEP
jgi:hypothetical protein